MILFLSFLLLVVAPALLLWMGRLAAALPVGDRAARMAAELAAEQDSAGAWYRRPMLPAFSAVARHAEPHESSGQAVNQDDQEREWFLRPMQPLIDWAALRRVLRRGRPGKQGLAGSRGVI